MPNKISSGCNDITCDIICTMSESRYEEHLEVLKTPKNVPFADLLRICKTLFGEPRTAGSHHIFKVPWPGEPRVNIQPDGNKAKSYQVKQVIKAIGRLKENDG